MREQDPIGRLVIIGAGPIGLESALEGLARGWEVQVFESGPEAGAAVHRWRHVPLFTPWSLMRGPRGQDLAASMHLELQADDAPLTGGDLLDKYLLPLAVSEKLADLIHTNCRVLNIARSQTRKTERIGDPDRLLDPFLVHVLDGDQEEQLVEADAVLDCTGISTEHNALGPGGGTVPGERRLRAQGEEAGFIQRIPDLADDDRSRFAGKRVLLLGGGHSVANALLGFEQLVQSSPETRVVWAWRGAKIPFQPDPADALPKRHELEQRVFAIAENPPAWLTVLPQRGVRAIEFDDGSATAPWTGRVRLQGVQQQTVLEVDLLLALIGNRPDLSLSRELQVHTCYATEGPMALAATLIASGTGDCMNQPATGPGVLATTEPGFFILGHKSYGRTPAFLLRDGYRQIAQAFDLLEVQKAVSV